MNKNANSADVRRLTRATGKAGKSLMRYPFYVKLFKLKIPVDSRLAMGKSLGLVAPIQSKTASLFS